MRSNLLPLVALLAVALVARRPAAADKQLFERTRDQVEAALDLEAELHTPARIRPGAPVQLKARLVNRSAKHTLKVIRPGNGCGMGIVEPHLHYTARFRATRADPWRDVEVRSFKGMCGMGDYRWHRNVTDLAPGAAIDLTPHLTATSAFVDFTKPGQYEVRLHYAFRRRGTTEKLPEADPVGDLGPMRRMPAFDVASKAVGVTVVRPIEVVVEVRDRPVKGVARRLSDLVSVRIENWTDAPLDLVAKRLHIVVRLRTGKEHARIRRKPISVSPGFTARTLATGASALLVGPKGIYDEAWVAESEGPVELQVEVAGARPGTPRVRSAWTRLQKD